jgi:transcriptional regulator with XRE-family HTH domain/tetratricopeptide (TPR) repeat protein
VPGLPDCLPVTAFGALLRDLRLRARVTQAELAARAGLSVRTVRNLETGRTVPRPDTVRLVAAALELPAADRATLRAAGRGDDPAPNRRRLPPEVADFTGRADAVRRLAALLEPDGPAPPVAVVVGPPGVGKSTLAVHVAHRLADRYPDGQLHVDLRGGTDPLDPGEALGQLLRAVGTAPAAVPADPAERTALFRSAVAGLRVLLVLDDAASAAQLRPLLPAGPGCAVLVTGRRRPVGLPGATVLELDVLPEEDAVALLARVAGGRRMAADPASAARVARLCGGLPLALRVAGARLTARPQWPVRRLADLLAGSRRRLDELTTGDLGVRASIDLSYRALGEADRRALRRLAVLDLPTVPGWTVAAALGEDDPEAAEEAADRLVDASLLGYAGTQLDGSAAYRFHDLLRAYGQEAAAAEDDPAERAAVLDRVLAVALVVGDELAEHGTHPEEHRPRSGFPRTPPAGRTLAALRADPVGWFAESRAALTGLVLHAAAAGRPQPAWDLVARLLPMYELERWYEDWTAVLEAALAAARATEPRAVPLVLRGYADQSMALGDWAATQRHLRAAAELSASLGDEDGLGWAHYTLGLTQHGFGRLAEARAAFEAAERAFAAAGHVPAVALFGLGAVLREQGELAAAEERLAGALAAARASGDYRLVAHLLRWLAELHADLGRPAEAERELAECSDRHRAIGDRLGEGYALQLRAELRLRLGRPDARPDADRARELFAELRVPQGEALALRTAARCALAAGDPAGARRDAGRAVELFAGLSMDLGLGRSLAVLAEAAAADGDPAAARAARERALALLEPLGVPEAAELARVLT